MVAYTFGVTAAWILRPRTARTSGLIYAFALVLVMGAVLGPTLSVNGGTRQVSIEQLQTNIVSLFTEAGTSTLDGSKAWRLAWWTSIVEYTVHGPYRWTGKGFGINLAKADGFAVDDALRSPHNGHLTILARTGIPGLTLWIGLHLAWVAVDPACMAHGTSSRPRGMGRTLCMPCCLLGSSAY